MLSFIGFWFAKFLAAVLIFVLIIVAIFGFAFISTWRENIRNRKQRETKP